ncbi:hypothetical protein L6452_35216 [Arctium lappa]|uniref:Uncharacterized protein n=1 Tax=Arctium lappa TaxID=4217 RepID=A0ACB8Y5V8_ARCLA|nr:hypothetical protein L6452_35216 [Arctium lappa]
MKDRTTGRARGFGFVVFLDPAVAERVVKEKHMIDGRTVEAKKAVPRDDQQSITRSNSSIHGSPGPTSTKKIFVGGLASTVTENDFKEYFDQFGTITDVVVMYDHNTQRPRGFGFITYNSEESVDKVLLKNFHELNGKMVEVKRAVPKELSPGPNRSQISGHNYGLSRVNSFLNAYTQGCNPSSVGGYGGRADGRFSPVSVGRGGYPSFSPSSYNVGFNSDSALGTNYRSNGNFSSNLGPIRALSPMFSVNANRYPSPIGYGIGGGGGNASHMSSPNHNIWGNGSQSYAHGSTNLGNFFAPGNGFGSNEAIWSNPSSNIGGIGGGGGGGGSSSFVGGNFNNGNEENPNGYGRNGGNSIAPASFYGGRDDGDIGALNSYGGGDSFYADPTWRSSSPELEVPGIFGYAPGSGASDGIRKNSVGYSGYSVENRSNRGIAA